MKTIIEFWKGVRGLVCVCQMYRCNQYDCRLVQEMYKNASDKLASLTRLK